MINELTYLTNLYNQTLIEMKYARKQKRDELTYKLRFIAKQRQQLFNQLNSNREAAND